MQARLLALHEPPKEFGAFRCQYCGELRHWVSQHQVTDCLEYFVYCQRLAVRYWDALTQLQFPFLKGAAPIELRNGFLLHDKDNSMVLGCVPGLPSLPYHWATHGVTEYYILTHSGY